MWILVAVFQFVFNDLATVERLKSPSLDVSVKKKIYKRNKKCNKPF